MLPNLRTRVDMIQQEFFENRGRVLVKTYSDKNKKIKQIETGNVYSSAIDITPCPYTYYETDLDIEWIGSKNLKTK